MPLVTVLRLLMLACKVARFVVWTLIEDNWDAKILLVEVVNSDILVCFDLLILIEKLKLY